MSRLRDRSAFISVAGSGSGVNFNVKKVNLNNLGNTSVLILEFFLSYNSRELRTRAASTPGG
jgi:hypothetical protein